MGHVLACRDMRGVLSGHEGSGYEGAERLPVDAVDIRFGWGHDLTTVLKGAACVSGFY